VLVADMVVVKVLVRLGRDFDRNDIASREMDDGADEWVGIVEYLSLEGEASWQKIIIPCMLALCHLREKTGGCLPGLASHRVQEAPNHQKIRHLGQILVDVVHKPPRTVHKWVR
jgi:hypothetical protein